MDRTLLDLIETARRTDRGVTFIQGAGDETTLSFRDLYDRALLLLGQFQDNGLTPGSEVMILASDDIDLVVGFWACVFGGMVPIPVPAGARASDAHRISSILKKLSQPFVLMSSDDRVKLENGAIPDERLIIPLDSRTGVGPGAPHEVKPTDIAYIQFSSGSTTSPRGVVLTHENLLANIRDIIERAEFDEHVRSLSWMPLTHDMGFIGFHLTPVALTIDHFLMPTALFVRRPLLWLEEATRKRITVLCSPNFGFSHYLRRFATEKEPDLDLSRVKLIFNGAEPISAATCHEFLDALAPFGLSSTVMYPVYGLAEASLAVAMPSPGKELRVHSVNRESLGLRDTLEAGEGQLVDVGNPLSNCRIRIASEDGKELADDTIGRVLIRGTSVTGGYYRDEGATADVVDSDGWLDTGDLGFMKDGRLTIAGRAKDIIFVNGVNHYPQDLELLAAEKGEIGDYDLRKVAIVGVREPGDATDQVLVFVHTRADDERFLALSNDLRKRLNEGAGVPIDHVIPVDGLPRTTSGKLQRYQLADRHLSGEFTERLERLEGLDSTATTATTGTTLDPLVQDLVNLWNASFDDMPIGPDDDFFGTGADSLALVEIFDLLDERFPGTLKMPDLIDHPTATELADYIRSKQS